MTTIPKLTAAEITPEWIEKVRKIISDEGMQAARPNPKTNGIQLRSTSDNQWRALMLETSRFEFATAEDRDEVLEMINAPCDHDWKFKDESFDHEFGTERVHTFECQKCGTSRPATAADRSEGDL